MTSIRLANGAAMVACDDPLNHTVPHILFVEDSLDDAELTRWHLSKAGIAFSWSMVWTAAELMEQLKVRCPDLIISDFLIPGFDGWAAFRMAQAMTPATPFIFHTGSTGDERFRIAKALGAFGCIEKERSAAMVDMVRRALHGRVESTPAFG